ncbi:hypothetical protein, partial [Haemophilus influenzae]|uniref:hypothetical protein n=1 Tax=Haemophilus influenzae TaxID=727 RepID=UPI000CC727E2
AIASDAAQGFVKVIADKKYGEILGVHIIGPAAAFMHQVTSTVLRCWLTQLSAWVKFPLKMPLKEIMQLPN